MKKTTSWWSWPAPGGRSAARIRHRDRLPHAAPPGACRRHQAARSRDRPARPARPRRSTAVSAEPPPQFGGMINLDAKESKPYWPPRVVPPKGAPNVLLIMTDDAATASSSTFGGVIPTPALDRIANDGLRYTQFHSTALCSPTRAALITGRNHHSVGFGVIAEQATGYPGLRPHHRRRTTRTIGEILKENGYATSWFGKNHNTPAFQYSQAGPFDQWPIGMGFEYFYGFIGGETDQWQPYLFRNTTPDLPVASASPDYNLITDMADEAIEHMKQLNAAAPDKPFFVYYVPGGTHAPHQPTPEWIEKFKGKFDMGWNELREQIFANQKRLGVIPANTKLTPWPDESSMPKWDTLTADEKKLFARQAEVYAAYVAYTDHEIGRVIQAVEDMGKLDNTLIIYISGDNGTSAEGSHDRHARTRWPRFNGIDVPVAEQLKFYDAWGSRQTYPHMSVAGPGRSTRRSSGPSRSPRTSAARARAWRSPGRTRIKDAGGIRNQFHHVIDIVPTILEATGIPAPVDGRRHRAEADRGREHGLHLRQGERRRAVDAHDAVLRDVRQPRRSTTRAGSPARRRPQPPWLMGTAQDARRGQRLQVGALRPHRGLLAGQRPRRARCPTS